MTRTTIKSLAALALVFGYAGAAQAATINFSHIEVSLADPNNSDETMRALWTTWFTQVYEYSMPFIEVSNTDTVALERFSLSIGDTDFQFGNEFRNKEFTNSFPHAANGEYAVAGYSTPGIDYTSSITDGGDTLVVDFGPGGLQPGEVVRFQVDINADVSGPNVPIFPNYTEVFFNNGDGPGGAENNSRVTLEYEGLTDPVTGILPDSAVAADVAQFFNAPRPHSVMQQITLFPGFTVDPIPEPTTAVLAMLAACGVASRRRVA